MNAFIPPKTPSFLRCSEARFLTKLVVVLLLPTCMAHSQGKEVEGTSYIRAVKVFRNGAEIEREANAKLVRGVNKVIFKGLSPYIDKNSIRIDGKDAFTILSVDHENRKVQEVEATERERALQDSIKDVEFKLALRQNLRTVYREEKSMILENKSIGGEQTGVDVDALMELSQYYRKRLKEIQYKMIELNNDIERFQKRIDEYREALKSIRKKRRESRGTITIRARSGKLVRATMKLRYVVNRAGWSPVYDIRCKAVKEPAELLYKGKVHQETGKDWTDVKLTLSTGDPMKSGSLPDMEPWYIDVREPIRVKENKGSMQQRVSVQQKKKAKAESVQKAGSKSGNERTKISRKGRIQTSFQVPSAYTIPSDGQEHGVEIVERSLPVVYRYHVLPRKDQTAFLVAGVTGWQGLDLLPGPTNNYYRGNFVGRSHLDPSTTDDTLRISLGQDPDIAVDRELLKDKTKERIFRGKVKRVRKIAITIRNNKEKKVGMKVLDQVPVSKHEDIQVTLEDKGKADHNDTNGTLGWNFLLPAGKKRTLSFEYLIEHPKNEAIQGL